MAHGSKLTNQPPADAASDLAELAASRSELVASITGMIDIYVRHLNQTPEEAATSARSLSPIESDGREPEQVSWSDISRLLEQEPEAGQALWAQVKDSARHELRTGVRVSKTLEPRLNATPYDRARVGVILESLAKALKPRDGLELLIVQQMAASLDQQLKWQTIATHRTEEETWQAERDRRRTWETLTPAQQERFGRYDGWLPPRLTDADAIEQAIVLADRFQRQFIRLLKALRDQRRLVGTLVVAGGQVNISDQQVNLATGNST
jgi:hypothetical protein